MKKTGILFIMVMLLLIPAQSRAMLEIAVGAWDQNIQGDLYYNLYDTAPDQADIKRDLGLEDDVRGTGYLKLDLPVLPSLYLGITPMEFRGTGQRDRMLIFGDYAFLGDRPLRSRMRLNHFDIGLYYSLSFPGMASMKNVKVDLGLNLRTAELDVSVTGSVPTADGGTRQQRESEDYTLPMPMLYGALQVTPVERISVEFEGRGISLSSDHLISVLGKIKFRTRGPLFFAAGYRYDYIRLDEDELNVDSTVHGLFCETGLEF